MNCFEYEKLISGYLDDELTKKELKSLLHHLEYCSNCKEELSTLIAQKQKIHALCSVSLGPVPDPDFSQQVVGAIYQSDLRLTAKTRSFKLSDFLAGFLFPLKKPIYAGVYSFLILMGLFLGVFVEKHLISPPGKKKLLNVYELQNKNLVPTKSHVASFEEQEKARVFYHVAFSSGETLVGEPCLLKYTAYAPESATKK